MKRKRLLLRSIPQKGAKPMKPRPIKTKLLTALLTLCMLLSLVPISAFAADSTVSNESELESALKNVDCAEIKLGGNIETTWQLDVERTVTLDLNGYTLSYSATDEDIFRVRSNGNLTVKDSGTDGKIDGQNKNCGFNVKGGTLTLESGSIVNCTDADGDGGAVDIGSGCTFIMNGGTISDCRADDDGGAVFIKQSGTFELNGGVIQNCSAGANGGAVNIYEDGRFTMTGGVIKDCKVDLGGYGIAVYGKDDKAIVAISGGTIENCGVNPWHFDAYTVTFDSDGGSAVTEQKVLNAPAVKPADPTKDGYDFAGWYLEDTQYAFDTTVTTDITLKAHWTPTSALTAISAATIENVKFHYQPSDAPQTTACVSEVDTDKYEIAYECWQQFESNQPVAAWYSDNDSHGSLPTITEFESGKTYVYSLMLKPKAGYSFSSETVVTVNGEKVSAPFVGGSMYIPSIKTITMPTVTVIDVVEINDVTVSFKDGDKPVFTGKVPDGASYAYRCEWWELNSTTGAMSTDFGNFYENKITAFEAGKTYYYGVYVTTYGDVGNVRYVFGPDTKLKINGEFVNYKRYEGDPSDGSDGTMWVLTDLAMTPEAGSTIPSEKYTVAYTDGVDGEEIFKDQSYTAGSGKTTPAFSGTPARDGYKFTGWSPAVAGTVTENVTYTAQWEKLDPAKAFTVTYTDGVDGEEIFKDQTYTVESGKATPAFNGAPTRKGYTFAGWKPAVAATVTGNATHEATWKVNSTTPSENKPNTGETTSPNTGDTNNMVLWAALLFVSGGVLVGTVVIGKKKKTIK